MRGFTGMKQPRLLNICCRPLNKIGQAACLFGMENGLFTEFCVSLHLQEPLFQRKVNLFQRYRSFAQQISAVLFLSDETSDSDRRFAYRSYPFVTGTRMYRSLSHSPSFSLPFYSLFRHATSVELFFRKGNRLSQSRQCRLPSRVIRKNLPLRSRAYFSVPALSDCSRHLSGAEK